MTAGYVAQHVGQSIAARTILRFLVTFRSSQADGPLRLCFATIWTVFLVGRLKQAQRPLHRLVGHHYRNLVVASLARVSVHAQPSRSHLRSGGQLGCKFRQTFQFSVRKSLH